MNVWQMLISEEFLSTGLQLTVPILFAALAALISNKAGILNINIEGSMSVSALCGALVSFYGKSFALGILAGMVSGILMGLLLSFCAHKLKTDSVLSGVTLNIFATGLCVFLMYSILGSKGDTTSAPSTQIPILEIPLLCKIPYVGVIFRQSVIFYLAVIAAVGVNFFFKRTRLGLRMKAVGYNPKAAETVGISVQKTQLTALVLTGALAGLGGVFMSMSYLSTFNSGMIAGRGFIGLAAEAMGGGSAYLTMLFAFIFGLVTTFSVNAQIVLSVPYELLNTLPYLMTVIALIIYAVIAKRKKFTNNKNTNIKGVKGGNVSPDAGRENEKSVDA